MSLATRCTACDTVFRVVQDQLKVSEGWVRCGRCQTVFNALEGLFDLEPGPAALAPAAVVSDDPPAALEPTPADAPPWPHASASTASTAATAGAASDALPAVVVPQAEPPVASRPADFAETPASRVAARDRNDFADAQFNSALLAEAAIEGVEDAPETPLIEPLPATEPAPEFLRQAERDARWQRPRAVLALGLVCGVLALTLAAQATFHYRDLLAAVAPPLRPALEALCDLAGCRIEALRRIDDIVIDSSTLTSAPSGENTVRLALVLRNRGALPLAMPSIELTLTDPGGQMLVRRALAPADFAAPSTALPAASERALQVVLATGSRRASGYTVEPFYP